MLSMNASIFFDVILVIGGILLGLVLFGILNLFLVRSDYRNKLKVIISRRADYPYIERNDEFGQVARELQQMDRKLEEETREANRLQQNLEGLLKISEASRITIPIDNIYQFILDVVMEVIGFAYGGIHLVEPNGKFAYVVATKSTPESILRHIEIEDFDRDYMRPLKETHEPYWINDSTLGSSDIPELVKRLGYHSILKIPILAGEQLIGVLTLSKKEPYAWPEEEVRWLSAVGRYLGILIDHIRVSKNLQEVSVLHERERISQELHDNFSQHIGTIHLLAARTLDKIDEADFSEIRNDVESIEQISQNAYSILRDEMYGLRLIREPDQELISTIREYLDRFRRQWSIETIFEIENLREPYIISPIINIQFLRILQETLTNVVRHAQATRVKVSLKEVDNRLVLEISDNGIGFNPNSDFNNRFGLKIVHERATSIGGKVEIISFLSSGTVVRLEIPKVVTKIGT